MVVECDTFQRHKGEMTLLPEMLDPLSIPTRIWTNISMDFIEGLPKYGGKAVILAVVDRLSKYSHFCALSHPYPDISSSWNPFFLCLRPQHNFHKSFSPH